MSLPMRWRCDRTHQRCEQHEDRECEQLVQSQRQRIGNDMDRPSSRAERYRAGQIGFGVHWASSDSRVKGGVIRRSTAARTTRRCCCDADTVSAKAVEDVSSCCSATELDTCRSGPIECASAPNRAAQALMSFGQAARMRRDRRTAPRPRAATLTLVRHSEKQALQPRGAQQTTPCRRLPCACVGRAACLLLT